MECKVKWVGEAMAFLAETGSNHTLVMDAPPEAGGHNMAPRPMELLLAGAGGCTAFDVVSILRKGRHAISACEVSLSAERAEGFHADSLSFSHQRQGAQAGSRRPRHRAFSGKILLCLDHARPKRRNQPRL